MDQVRKLLFGVIVMSVISITTPVVIRAVWVVDERGQVVWEEGMILGREDDNDDDDDEARSRTEIRDGEVRREIRTETGERIEFRSREGETRTEVRSGGVRVRLERKDGEMKLRAEREDGEKEELGEQNLLRIREREDKDEIEVEAGEEEGEFVVRRGQMQARTNFPLSINLATNELVVTTPAGEKVVTVLPDQAVQNMLAANVIDQLISATTSGVILGERQGVPVYEIPGVKKKKLLGFIPVTIEQTAVVSAETGEVVATEDVSLVEQVISLLSVD